MATDVTILFADRWPGEPGWTLAGRLGRAGARVEIVTEAPGTEEFIELDDEGRCVHRVSGRRSYLLRALGLVDAPGALAFAVRAIERCWELSGLWDRRIRHVETASARLPGSLVRLLLTRENLPPPAGEGRAEGRRAPSSGTVQGADVILCSYRRLPELSVALRSVTREIARARARGIDCGVTVVHQEQDLPARIAAGGGVGDVRFVFSSPPSLTRARNDGLAATSRDLVVFVDDDVVLGRGFLAAHLAAANRWPAAAGVAGRIRSRSERGKLTRRLAVGQIRASGVIETNYDSLSRGRTLVAQTPMGTNMAFKRRLVNALLGPRWFDERLSSSAFREESLLSVELFRRGAYLVYEPRAALYHFESLRGGCESRAPRRPLEARARHLGLDYHFVRRLHQDSPFGPLAALLLAARDLRDVPTARILAAKLYLNARGWWLGRRLAPG